MARHQPDERVFIVGMNQSDDQNLFVLNIGRVAVVLELFRKTPDRAFYFRPSNFTDGLCVAVRDGEFVTSNPVMFAKAREIANSFGVAFLERDCVLSGMVSVMDPNTVIERYEG